MPRGLRAGFPTYWRCAGEGPEAAVLIHCSLAHSGALTALMSRLSDRLSMVAFDLPGHGRSGDWDRRGDIQEISTRIAESFCHRPGLLIGHSFGATVALRLAVERPDLATGLVLIEPVLFAAAARAGSQDYARHLDEMTAYQNAVSRQDWTQAARRFTDIRGAELGWNALSAADRQALTDRVWLISEADNALFADSGGILRPGGLEALGCPVLLIEGDRSPAIIDAVLAALAARLRDVRRVVIPGAGHMAPITHPDDVARAIRDWL